MSQPFVLTQNVHQYINFMRRKNPLLIVSSFQSNSNFIPCDPSQQVSEPRINSRQKQQKKFIIKSLNHHIKFRTISIQQKQQLLQMSKMNCIQKRKNIPLPIQRSFDHSIQLFIGTLLSKQPKDSRFSSRERSNMRKYTYHVRKEENEKDFIKKSLLEPCQITSATINERKKTAYYSKFHSKEYEHNRISDFSFRKRYKNISKYLPQKLQPWTSETLEIDQQNF